MSENCIYKWKCIVCDEFTDIASNYCYACGTPRKREPVLSAQLLTVYLDLPSPAAIQVWICTCGAGNSYGFEWCRRCGRHLGSSRKNCYYTCECGNGNWYSRSDKLYPNLVCSCGITTDINDLYEMPL